MGAVAAILCGAGGLWIQGAAFLAGMAAVLLTVCLANLMGHGNWVHLLLSGIVVKAAADSALMALKYAADPTGQLALMDYWLMGSFTSASYQKILIGCPLIVAGIIIIYLLRWRLNILSLSDDEARARGINIKQTRMLFIVASTLVTASAVSMCGQVGWIGLLIPHASRMLVGSNNRYVVPLSLSLGASFMILIDTLSRSISIIELPLSILTAIIGAPAFISLLNKTRSNLQ